MKNKLLKRLRWNNPLVGPGRGIDTACMWFNFIETVVARHENENIPRLAELYCLGDILSKLKIVK